MLVTFDVYVQEIDAISQHRQLHGNIIPVKSRLNRYPEAHIA
jgi:hypothetical protein